MQSFYSALPAEFYQLALIPLILKHFRSFSLKPGAGKVLVYNPVICTQKIDILDNLNIYFVLKSI